MHTQTFKEYCTETGVTSICKTIRINSAHSYPFITVLRGKIAENIYLSKASASKVSEGDSVKSIASELLVATAPNADGEDRTKLFFQGDSSYESVEDMFE